MSSPPSTVPNPTPHAALLDGLNAPDLDFELDLPHLVRVLGGRL